MKTSNARRALVLADLFNLLVAIYLIVIAIVSLVKLRWYHQLTIAVRVRHVITSATSYFAFFILLFAGLVLVAIFVVGLLRLNPRTYVSPLRERAGVGGTFAAAAAQQPQPAQPTQQQQQQQQPEATNNSLETRAAAEQTGAKQPLYSHARLSPRNRLKAEESVSIHYSGSPAICYAILLHLLAAVSLIIVLLLWLLNTGELVRDSISTQLDSALAKYQFSNRSNHYSVAIDGMQDVNHCCGSLDYSDFPHQRLSGLSSGHYPGSCCGKSYYGVNARVICTPEEIVRNRQTAGCTTVLANYYDLMSLLIVPVALVSLFVNITIIGLIIISKGHADGLGLELDRDRERDRERDPNPQRAKFELKSAAI